jgi:hypothetical protein
MSKASMRTALVAPLVVLLALAGCKTTSTSPSTPQPPGSPSTASSSSSSPSSAGTSGSPSAAGTPGARTAERKDTGAVPTASGKQQGQRNAAGEPGTAADAQRAGAEPQPGAPSDQVTLEDGETAASGGSEADAATSEQEVLDAALEAMQRGAQQPSLEEAAARGAGPAEGGTAGQPAGDAQMTGGASAAGAASAAAGAGDIRAAAGGVTAGGYGDGELERLNRELNDSLARFDGAMLGERQRNQARTEESGGGRAGTSTAALEKEAAAGGEGSEDSSSDGAPMPARSGGAAEGTANDSSSGSGMSTAGGGSGRKGDFEHTASNSGNVPADIPDGTDDDVVARQIREAAMKEKDPELREKLWDEYRKYTGSMKR